MKMPSKENIKEISESTKWLRGQYHEGYHSGANVQIWIDLDTSELHSEDHVSGNSWIQLEDPNCINLGFFKYPVTQKTIKEMAKKAIKEAKA